VGIVTDSASDLPEEVIRAHGIKVVPLTLVREGESLRDGVDLTAEEFHQTLRDGGPLPTTSQPPPRAFLDAYQEAADEAESVVGVFLGSNLSGTFRSAEAAAYQFDGGPVHLVDSYGASLLTGLMVLKATELAELALSPEEIVVELRRIRRQSGVILTVDSMDRLLASGRIGKGKAWLATFLGLKPILSVPLEGPPVASAGRAFGRKRVLPAVLDILHQEIPPGAQKVRFGVIHVARPEIVDEVARALETEFGDVEILSARATPVLATHTGVGAWAVAYLVED
jgi:DegV family protein with EDD domain